MSAADALQRSLNVPAVDLLDRIGAARFYARLANAGMRLQLPPNATPNLSLILGGAGTNLEQLVGAYRSLAMAGMAAKPRMTPQEELKEARMMSRPGAAYIVRAILEAGGNPDRAFIETGGASLAWKTGTSYGFRDAWAVGVVDSYTLGVWIGRPDGTPNPGFFGANVAAPLLQQIASALPKRGELNRSKPASVSSSVICWPLGYAAQHTAPEPTTGWRTLPHCQANAQAQKIARWPALLEVWLSAAEKQRYGLTQAQHWDADCQPHFNASKVRINGLKPDSRLRPVPGHTHIPLTLEAVATQGPHYWLLDGKLVAQSQHHHKKTARLVLDSAGQHSIALIDSAGNHTSVDFWVDL